MMFQEAMVDFGTYKLALDSIRKHPKKIVDQLINDAESEGRRERINNLRKDIERAIPIAKKEI